MTDDKVLGDHQWNRSTLIPPFVDSLGDSLEMVNWAKEQLPDFVWIGLIYEELGGRRTTEIITELAERAQDIQEGQNFVLLSDFVILDNEEMQSLADTLSESVLDDLELALEPLIANYPSCPLAPLLDSVPEQQEDHINELAELVAELSNRRSELSVHVQGFYIGSLMATGRLKIAPDSPLADINEVFRYPETEYSQEVASVVRASTKAMNQTPSEAEEYTSDWITEFWQRGFELTECTHPHEINDEQAKIEEIRRERYEELADIGIEYDKELRKSILEIWWEAEFEAEFTGKSEVLDGLLLRQVNLATTVARTPAMWSQDIATIILRAMSENHIVLEWLNKNGQRKHYQDYIEYGLGQEKLFLEHSERVVSGSDDDDRADGISKGMDSLEQRLEAQRARYLLPVDVGHWANKNTRELAQEADLKDFYDMRFQQYSASVHGQWNALYKQNLVICRNPLHQYHRIPNFNHVSLNPISIVEVGNIMNRSFSSWIEARNIPIDDPEIPDIAETVREILDK